MSALKSIKVGYDNLVEEEKHWAAEIDFYPSEGNVRAHRLVVARLNEFKQCYALQLSQIEKYPFLAK